MSRIDRENRVPLGANRRADGAWEFLVWAPDRHRVDLHVLDSRNRLIPMVKNRCGYHQVVVNDIERQARYVYRFDVLPEYPDPSVQFHPVTVQLPSKITDVYAVH